MTVNPLGAPLPRRTVLTAAAATGLLAACGTGATDTETHTASASTAPPVDTADNASGEILATTAEVPVAGGIINSEAKYVVTQPTAGQFRGFSSVCPHQQCDVSAVEQAQIVCRCHGSRFNTDTGDVESGPATRGLALIVVEVQGGNVVRV